MEREKLLIIIPVYNESSSIENQYSVVKKVLAGDITGFQKEKSILVYKTISSSIPDFSKVSLIRISFFNPFSENNKAKIIVSN